MYMSSAVVKGHFVFVTAHSQSRQGQQTNYWTKKTWMSVLQQMPTKTYAGEKNALLYLDIVFTKFPSQTSALHVSNYHQPDSMMGV